MEKKNLFYLLIMGTFILSGCATPSIKVKTNPTEAKVTVVGNMGEVQSLGMTPLSRGLKDLNIKGPFLVEVEKEGYQAKSLFIPNNFYGKDIDLQITMNRMGDLKNLPSDAMDGEKLIRDVIMIQTHIHKREFLEAQSKLQKTIEVHRSYSSLWSLLGNVYYLQRRWEQAEEAYRRSFELDPTNLEVKSMMEKSKSLRGGN